MMPNAAINKPKCKLIGTDGNVFALAAQVTRTLKRNKQFDMAKEFTNKLMRCGNYEEALQLIMQYVEVE